MYVIRKINIEKHVKTYERFPNSIHNCECAVHSKYSVWCVSVCVRAGVYRLMHAVLFHIGHRTSLSFSAHPQLPLKAIKKHVLKMPGIAIKSVFL